MFHVGMRVVCVDAGPKPGTRDFDPGEKPVEGAIYTVRRCFIRNSRQTLWLDEIARDAVSREQCGDDVGYGSWRFRPVRTTDAGMAKLNRLLLPKLKKAARKTERA